jgi:GR25 family glycosyltransferase involved in LPS biosynthesis
MAEHALYSASRAWLMPHAGDAIEGVFINLDRAAERRAAMERQLSEARPPYPIERFAAIDGSLQPGCPRNLRPGQYGCWLSHLAALERSIANGRHLHVMEDDALLSRKLAVVPEALGALASDPGASWDILYLDATLVELADMYQMFDWVQEARPQGMVNLHRIPAEFSVYGALSYIVNSSRKKYVHDYLRSYLHAGAPLDNVFAAGIRDGRLKAYLTAPFLTSGSDASMVSTLGYEDGHGFLAWFLFRRLCFFDLSEEAADGLNARIAELTQDLTREQAIFGALCGHRVAKWPNSRFAPRVERG